MNQGIMTVSKVCNPALVRRLLPPEHSVVAVRPIEDGDAEEWLIEGAHMPPPSIPGVPDRVTLMIGPLMIGYGCWGHDRTLRWDIPRGLILEVLLGALTLGAP
jgi:hypothetical protein